MKERIFLFVVALIAPALFAMPAKADTIDQVTFMVNISSGSQSGDVFTGSLTYDATTLALNGSAPLLTFTFSDPAWNGMTLSSPGVVAASFVPGELFFTFFGIGQPDDAFILRNFFIYGTTVVPGSTLVEDGEGTVTLSAPTVVSTPEPSTLALLGIGLLGLLGRIRRERLVLALRHRLARFPSATLS